MCVLCDGGTVEEWLDGTRERIEEHGFTMVSVDAKSPWTYTIGLLESFGHPELVITGVDPSAAQDLLRAFVAHIRSGDGFERGDVSLHGVPFRIGDVHPTQWVHGRFAMWVNYYGERGARSGELPPTPVAVQILWPNEDDVFPPDRDFCDVHRNCQPLLSVLVAHDVHEPVGRPRRRRKRKGKK